ncbi:MAG: histidine--tRNA ligase [Candidatus Paceibacterota bacterium]|jgi:histidyl-tRNA synthetase
MSQKIQTSALPGFMELLPAEQMLFDALKDSIRASYEKFGFIPLDTPVIERSEVLLSNAGGETEKQIYRFNKGDNDLSLRFDQTIPLARFVAEHFRDLTFPFKRYAISKVFRGESPQRGRFREFYQCDIDVIGNEILPIVYDAEIVAVIVETLSKLNIGAFTVRINNRKLLGGLLASLQLSEKSKDILRIIDKLDKIGGSECRKMLAEISVSETASDAIFGFLNIIGSVDEKISTLKKLAEEINNSIFTEGVKELEETVQYIRFYNVSDTSFMIDFSIARGLDYYTGTVYETTLNKYPKLGSICSGGRYENLAEKFINQKLPGVGISIGLTRLFDQLLDAKVLKTSFSTPARVIVIPVTAESDAVAAKMASELRKAGIATDTYLAIKNFKKALSYTNKLGIPYAIIIGDDEIKNNTVALKDMVTGEQKEVAQNILVAEILEKVTLLK